MTRVCITATKPWCYASTVVCIVGERFISALVPGFIGYLIAHGYQWLVGNHVQEFVRKKDAHGGWRWLDGGEGVGGTPTEVPRADFLYLYTLATCGVALRVPGRVDKNMVITGIRHRERWSGGWLERWEGWIDGRVAMWMTRG